jgi:hypothetical protein
MKTPREILLNRHQSANARLDALRARVLSAALPPTAQPAQPSAHVETSLLIRAALKLWQELFRPCRRAWAGLAVSWLVLWGINLGLSDAPKTARNAHPVSAPAMFQALEEQRQILAELIPSADSQPAEPPRRNNPRPRSERQGGFMTA